MRWNTLERVCDAMADDELRELGLRTAPVVALLEGLVLARLPERSAGHAAQT
jgi:hypothetical protein